MDGVPVMCKVSEVFQHYQEVQEKYQEQVGDKKKEEFTSEDYNVFIERLESELAYREVSEDEYKFNRFTKPVLLHRISRAWGEREAVKFLKELGIRRLLVVTDPYFYENGTAKAVAGASGAGEVEWFPHVEPEKNTMAFPKSMALPPPRATTVSG